MFQVLTRRGSAPSLADEVAFHVHPASVQCLGAAEALDLDGGVGAINQELVAVAVSGWPHFAADDAIGAAEKANHAVLIGTSGKGWRGLRPFSPQSSKGRSIASRAPVSVFVTDT